MQSVGLALGSGGWKGLAHLGVLRALEEMEVRPTLYAGSSVGALMATAAACRIRISDLERLAEECHQRSLFRLDLGNLVRYGIRTPALFGDRPLRSLCHRLFGRMTFADLPTPALVATVDIRSGETIWWGAPGHRMVPVADAVYASCAMPGLLPPGRVGPNLCIDGGVLDPLGLPDLNGVVDRIIAVELDCLPPLAGPTGRLSGVTLWSRAQSLVMRDLTRRVLRTWDGPPMQVIRPRLRGAEVLRATNPARMMDAGYEAAWSLLEGEGETARYFSAPSD